MMKKIGVSIILLLLLFGGYYWGGTYAKKVTEAEKINALVDNWVKQARRKNADVPISPKLQAQNVTLGLVEQCKVHLISGQSPIVGRDRVRSLLTALYERADSVTFYLWHRNLSIDPTDHSAQMQIDMRVKSFFGSKEEIGDGSFELEWINENGEWKILSISRRY
jgi:hypothetical protein